MDLTNTASEQQQEVQKEVQNKVVTPGELLLRGVALIAVFGLLVSYLYLVQEGYEHTEKGLTRLLFFAATIFGAGLTWDVSKHVASLQIAHLKGTMNESGKAVGYFIGYVGLAAFTAALTSGLAGPLTVLTPFTALASLASGVQFIRTVSRAIEHATKD